MSADAEEVVVSVEPELPLDDKKPDVVVASDDDAVNDLKTQFAELQARAQEDRSAREAAEARARQMAQEAEFARREAMSAKTEVADSQLSTVSSGLSAAETEAAAAEAAYAKAMEEGNFAQAAKEQRRMARAESEIVALSQAKNDLEARKGRDEPRQQSSEDPFETYISTKTEPTANWLRAHKEWVVDPRKNARLTAAHYAAVADGLVPDSKQYFEAVETFIGERKVEAPKEAPKKPAPPPVAPVGRSANGSSVGAGGNEVRLTKSEAMAATDGTHTWNYDDPSGQKKFRKGDPIGIQEFARRKKAMMEQGLYDRSYIEQ